MENASEENSNSGRFLVYFLIFVGLSVIAFIGAILLIYFTKYELWNGSKADFGTFGDFVGGTLNPGLSFLGFMALLYTIYLQSKELESNRQELKRAASAQAKTDAMLESQTETLARQQFEGTFFALLELHNSVLERLMLPSSRPSSGQSDMDMILEQIFNKGISDIPRAKLRIEELNAYVGHYFRILYQLLKLIATNTPGTNIGGNFTTDVITTASIGREKIYSNIVRGFLGYEITQLLAVNCYSPDAQDSYWRYRLLIERYEFLEHMPFEINGAEHPLLIETKRRYDKKAFGKSDFLAGKV